jgi:hypothetical protein
MVDMSKSHILTSDDYIEQLQDKTARKEIIEKAKAQKKQQ